ncbi:MAG: hypothetical protein Ta2D_06190 [Rickettsiales bacterium]|nr:MAG: hypothetical protein Ta2D_06190 [Rickettsiales bacterium]
MKKILILFLVLTNLAFAIDLKGLAKTATATTTTKSGGGGACALDSIFADIKKEAKTELQIQLKSISTDLKNESMKKLDSLKDEMKEEVMKKLDDKLIAKAQNLVNRAEKEFNTIMGYVGLIKIAAIVVVLVLVLFIACLTLSIFRLKAVLKTNKLLLEKLK